MRQSNDRAACTAVSSGLARPPLHLLPLTGPKTSRHRCWCLWNIVSMRPCVCRPSDIIGLSSLLLCVCSLVLGRCPPAGTGEDSDTPSCCSSAPVSSRCSPVNHGHGQVNGGCCGLLRSQYRRSAPALPRCHQQWRSAAAGTARVLASLPAANRRACPPAKAASLTSWSRLSVGSADNPGPRTACCLRVVMSLVPL